MKLKLLTQDKTRKIRLQKLSSVGVEIIGDIALVFIVIFVNLSNSISHLSQPLEQTKLMDTFIFLAR